MNGSRRTCFSAWNLLSFNITRIKKWKWIRNSHILILHAHNLVVGVVGIFCTLPRLIIFKKAFNFNFIQNRWGLFFNKFDILFLKLHLVAKNNRNWRIINQNWRHYGVILFLQGQNGIGFLYFWFWAFLVNFGHKNVFLGCGNSINKVGALHHLVPINSNNWIWTFNI